MKKFAYVGCRTTKDRNARGRGLKVYSIDEEDNWEEIQLVENVINPSYLCFDKNKEYLYTVHGDISSVSSFKICKDSGKLEYLNTVDSGGRNPVFVTADKNNRYIYTAMLQGGAVCTLKRNEDGSLTNPVFKANLPGKSRDSVSHAHQCLWDNSMQYLLVPAQGRRSGYSQVNVFKANDDGSLTLVHCQKAREHDEPRHAVMNGSNRYAYVVNEKGNSVTFYEFNGSNGSLKPKQTNSTLPEDYRGKGQASAILVHPNDRFLYVSNRIHDSITILAIDESTGFLSFSGNMPTLGKTPRFMTFNQKGTQLIAANEDSDTIKIFNVNHENGSLIFTGKTIETESPVCVVFAD